MLIHVFCSVTYRTNYFSTQMGFFSDEGKMHSALGIKYFYAIPLYIITNLSRGNECSETERGLAGKPRHCHDLASAYAVHGIGNSLRRNLLEVFYPSSKVLLPFI